jgi:hypothetical protein
MLRNRLLALIGISTLVGLTHHADHVIRGNHVGWPVNDEVNAFSFSLAIYPVIALGPYLYSRRLVGPGFWAIPFTATTVSVSLVHYFIELPRDIIELYEPRLIGWAAFGVLVAFLSMMATTAIYAARLRAHQVRGRHAMPHVAN